MPESFAPSVVVDGKSLTPPGWMWVLGFALRGVEWAIKRADTEEFKAIVQAWIVENKRQDLREQIADCEEHLVKLRQELHITK